MKNMYRGQRAIIIGNGPSLRSMDLSVLEAELTFGLNRAYLMFDDIGFSTTFLLATEQNVIEQFGGDMAATNSEVMLSHRFAGSLGLPSTTLQFLSRAFPSFGYDPLFWGFHDGNTVTYTAMQLAFYLGFEQAILIGVDHSFTVPKETHAQHAVVVAEDDDPNHFSPAYFGRGIKWMLPDLDGSEVSYRRARSAWESAGRSILDATVDGKLEVFPKVSWSDVVPRLDGTAGPLRDLATPHDGGAGSRRR